MKTNVGMALCVALLLSWMLILAQALAMSSANNSYRALLESDKELQAADDNLKAASQELSETCAKIARSK
jgi:hypothetical protein